MGMISRTLGAIYGILSYLIGFASLILFILFANNHIVALGEIELYQFAIDIGTYVDNALWINIGLLLIFGLQHSVMARPGFKKVLTKIVPKNLERSTYVLMTGVALGLIVYFWQPMRGTIWQVDNDIARLAITGIYYIGWLITLLATFMINHFHLFGLQQSMGSDPDRGTKEFVTPFFYKFVRHPIQTGVFISMLATPEMSMGRFVLTVGMIGYIFVGLYFEERDLIKEFGDVYRGYKKRVPGLLPIKFTSRDKAEAKNTDANPAE